MKAYSQLIKIRSHWWLFHVKYNQHINHKGAQWLSVRVCDSRQMGCGGWRLSGVTVLCPSARHIDNCLVLVQPRKTRHESQAVISEKLLTGM